jgi:NAD-dependent SIR2 family protein deacetylase
MKNLYMNSNYLEEIKQWLCNADAIVVGAGSGLSSACGYSHYNTVPFFTDNMQPFIEKYGIKSLFQGLTYLYSSPEEEWAYLAHYVKLMYDTPAGKPYKDLYKLLSNKPYFILTTNVDMQLDKVFPSKNICHFQGDMHYRQCQQPCNDEVYKNDDIVKMVNNLTDPTLLPPDAVPRCPHCGRVMSLWVRDYNFSEGAHWQQQVDNYRNFLKQNRDKRILFLELGVGDMTPNIIKLPFWKMTKELPNARYVVINTKGVENKSALSELCQASPNCCAHGGSKHASIPLQLQGKAMALDQDLAIALHQLTKS